MFIALEGIGGTGKGTLKTQLFELMEKKGIPHIKTREPGGTPIAEHLRELTRSGFRIDGGVEFATPMATALLFNAARSEHWATLIEPALKDDYLVLTDRFCDSTFTYQSVFMGIDIEKLKQLHDMVIGVYPTMTFLLDCPAEIAMARVTDFEKSRDQFDRIGVEKQERMREVYLELAAAEPHRYYVIDASGTPEHVWAQVEPLFLKTVLPSAAFAEYVYSS
jgi:dTMP kinase